MLRLGCSEQDKLPASFFSGLKKRGEEIRISLFRKHQVSIKQTREHVFN